MPITSDDFVVCVNVCIQAAPGGWTLYTSKRIGKEGLIVACDLLELDTRCLQTIKGNTQGSTVEIIYGDFTAPDVKRLIIMALQDWNRQKKRHMDDTSNPKDDDWKAHCIMSDMAVNFTGNRSTDALRTMNLCVDALMFAIGGYSDEQPNILRKGGSFLCKFFPCGKFHEHDLLQVAKGLFRYTTLFKPAASRKESSEVYLYAGDFLGDRSMEGVSGK